MNAHPGNIEERLRAMLHDERLVLPGWPDAVQRVRDGLTRKHRWRRLLGVWGAVLGAVLAALALRLVVSAPTGTNIPPTPTPLAWLDLPTQPPDFSIPLPRPEAPTCTPAQLATTAVAINQGAAGGSWFVLFTIDRVGDGRCTLSGSPQLIGTDVVTGKRVSVLSQDDPGISGGGKLFPAVLEPGETASLDLRTSLLCPPAPRRYRDLALATPAYTLTVVDFVLESSCAVGVGQWYVALPEPVIPPHYAGLTVSLVAPPTAQPGQVYRYEVVLANSTSAPITLDPCPVYGQSLFKSGGYYLLNCSSAEVPAGGELRFAMALVLDAQTPLGPTKLNWRLFDSGDNLPEASATVQITY
jgi:hypothetical protein